MCSLNLSWRGVGRGPVPRLSSRKAHSSRRRRCLVRQDVRPAASRLGEKPHTPLSEAVRATLAALKVRSPDRPHWCVR